MKLYVPINESVCNKYEKSEKENDIRFQGNPDNILPLKYSKIEIKPEKAKTKEILLNFLK